MEEGIQWEMKFPGGEKAFCISSYGKEGNLLKAEAENGWFKLEPAYEYEGLEGETSEAKMNFPTINQQAAQMDNFALCIMNETESRVPGEMGCRDVEIMIAIYESARTGREIELHLESYKSLVES